MWLGECQALQGSLVGPVPIRSGHGNSRPILWPGAREGKAVAGVGADG